MVVSARGGGGRGPGRGMGRERGETEKRERLRIVLRRTRQIEVLQYKEDQEIVVSL